MTMAIAFELRGVARSYVTAGPPVHALRATDLRVPAGSYTAIVGASGSGKSTLLNLLGLLDLPSSGSVFVDGVDTGALRHRERVALRAERIGFVFQAFHLLPGRTVLDNASLSLLYAGVPRRERMRRAGSVLERVGLADRVHADAATLSGGERQRVAIARAVIGGAGLLLCDEPTGNLDRETGDAVLGLLGELHRGGTTVVAVTHDPQVARRAERVVVVADGVVEGVAV